MYYEMGGYGHQQEHNELEVICMPVWMFLDAVQFAIVVLESHFMPIPFPVTEQ